MKLNTKIITTGLMTMITCALVGSITGTFAWYAYSTRATAELTGTTFGKAANLQLGIVATDSEISSIESVGEGESLKSGDQRWDEFYKNACLKKDGNIYWSYLGGGLSQSIIEDYLDLMGYSRQGMRPTTSGVYTEEGEENPNFKPEKLIDKDNYPYLINNLDITPKTMPTDEREGDVVASKNDYSVLPLAMRVIDVKNSESTTVPMNNVDIYVSNIDFSALGSNGIAESSLLESSNIAKAFRIDFKTWNSDETKANRDIVSPGYATGSSIKIGGLLDSDLDGYVDVDLYKEVQNGENTETVEVIDYDYMIRSEHLYGAVKDESHNEYVNVLNPDYGTSYPENTIKVRTATNNSVQLSDVSVSSYNSLTFKPQYIYEANPNYNPLDASSYPYILYKEQVSSKIEWVMKNAENPLINDNNRKEINENPDNYELSIDENNVLSLTKLEGSVKDYMLVQKGSSFELHKIEGNEVNNPRFVYEAKNDGSGYIIRTRMEGETQVQTENPLKGEINDFEGYYYVKDTSNAEVGLKMVKPNKLLKDYCVYEDEESESLYKIDESNHIYGLQQIENDNYDFSILYKKNGNELIAKETNEKALYPESDKITEEYTREVNLNGLEYNERKHQAKTYTVKSYEAYEQQYLGRTEFVGKFNKGKLAVDNTGKVVCNTGEDGIVYCKLTMWLEGWDDACDLSVLDVKYGLGIQFQIERLDK